MVLDKKMTWCKIYEVLKINDMKKDSVNHFVLCKSAFCYVSMQSSKWRNSEGISNRF